MTARRTIPICSLKVATCSKAFSFVLAARVTPALKSKISTSRWGADFWPQTLPNDLDVKKNESKIKRASAFWVIQQEVAAALLRGSETGSLPPVERKSLWAFQPACHGPSTPLPIVSVARISTHGLG